MYFLIFLLGFLSVSSWLVLVKKPEVLTIGLIVAMVTAQNLKNFMLGKPQGACAKELEFPELDFVKTSIVTQYSSGPLESKVVEKDDEDPVTSRTKHMDRFILLPIQYPEIWKLYKECLSSFWTIDEVNLEKDVQQYRLMLSIEEKKLLDATLGFFACADGIVGENLVSRFFSEVTIPEARAFYANQILMETIHAEMYSVIIDQLCPSVEEKNRLLRGFETNCNIQEKADYALRYIEDSESSFGSRLLAFLVVEGIFFSASFASIFWFKQRGLLPGIIFSNELIARDEAAHCRCCVALYSIIKNRLSEAEVHKIFLKGVDIEKRFARNAISTKLEGLEYDSMAQYIEYVANYWLAALGYGPVIVPAPKNPFPFMEMISLPGKGNFFECGISEYGKPEASGKFADITRTDF